MMFPIPLAALGLADYGILLVYMGAMLAIGFYFNSIQNSTEEFFLASRSLGWFPLGLSLMATLISAMTYTALPGQAYEVGLRTLLMPVGLWLSIPILWGVAIPIFRGLRMSSIYEYLELRFDARTRLAATILFAVWRLLWLGGVLYAPCKAFSVAAGWSIPEGYLIVVLGLVTTGYTFLGGMKAVVWTDVIQGIVMLLGIVVVVLACWLMIQGGPTRVWQLAGLLHRTELMPNQFSLQDRWSLWGFLPHFALAMLSFYLADQITAQRFLTAKSVGAAQQSFAWNCAALTFLFPGLTYIGLCLLAYYHDHPAKCDRSGWSTWQWSTASRNIKRGKMVCRCSILTAQNIA
jgi:SSS family transporter